MKPVNLAIFKPTAIILMCTFVVFSGVAMAQPSCLTPGGGVTPINVEVDASNAIAIASKKLCLGQVAANHSNGYFCVELNTQSKLKFHLTHDPAATKAFKFIGFQLSVDGVQWPSTLPLGAYSDFEFGTQKALANAKPYAKINGAGNMMDIQNKNCHFYRVYYRLILQDTASDDVVYVHPAIDNRGTN